MKARVWVGAAATELDWTAWVPHTDMDMAMDMGADAAAGSCVDTGAGAAMGGVASEAVGATVAAGALVPHAPAPTPASWLPGATTPFSSPPAWGAATPEDKPPVAMVVATGADAAALSAAVAAHCAASFPSADATGATEGGCGNPMALDAGGPGREAAVAVAPARAAMSAAGCAVRICPRGCGATPAPTEAWGATRGAAYGANEGEGGWVWAVRPTEGSPAGKAVTMC